MGWVARKFDNLGSAAAGGAGGIGLSQAPAFTQAYLQRLGGHIDEARRTLLQVEGGQMLSGLSAADRTSAAAELSLRVAELERAYAAIAESHPLIRPLMMLGHADLDIAGRAFEHFNPAMPVDVASLTWTGIGIVLALVVYELCKSPALLFRRKRSNRHLRSTPRR